MPRSDKKVFKPQRVKKEVLDQDSLDQKVYLGFALNVLKDEALDDDD